MTKAHIKYIQSLSRQKYRKEHNAYVVEGDKNAKEWLQSKSHILYIAGIESWLRENRELLAAHPEAEVLPVADFELEKITSLQSAQMVLLVVQQPGLAPFNQNEGSWSLFLEKIQDPGNMGTIIRTADWFGIKQIICSPDCVEIYNPKVVQASMGSLLRVAIRESDTERFIQENQLPIYATSLSGEDIGKIKQPQPGIIAMGNESQGLSDALMAAAGTRVTIPRIGHAESLNVAVATGIVCAALLG
jgi:TrmH family RNA methyltransferase